MLLEPLEEANWHSKIKLNKQHDLKWWDRNHPGIKVRNCHVKTLLLINKFRRTVWSPSVQPIITLLRERSHVTLSNPYYCIELLSCTRLWGKLYTISSSIPQTTLNIYLTLVFHHLHSLPPALYSPLLLQNCAKSFACAYQTAVFPSNAEE